MNLPLKKHKRATIALGTLVEISVWLDDTQHPDTFFRSAYQAVNEIHRLMNVHDEQSDIGRYRLSQCGTQLPIHAHTAHVLQFSEQLWQETDGYFDVCIGRTLANTVANNGHAPNKPSLKNKRNAHRSQTLDIRQQHDGSAILHKTLDNVIDLGGVAKGYAVDHAIQTLKNLNAPAAMVNAGGDMRIYGEVEEAIHLRENGDYHPFFRLKDRALASSAIPSNWDTPPQYLPIVNPKTQTCLKASTQSKSIVADLAMVADAFTKLAWLDVLDNTLCERYNAQLIQQRGFVCASI